MCNGFFEIPKWHVESNVYGNYLVFDGNEQVRDKVLAILEKGRIGIKSYAQSRRSADDGYHYDWYARLENGGTNEECNATIVELFEAANSQQANGHEGGVVIEKLDFLVDTLSVTYERLLQAKESQLEMTVERLKKSEEETLRVKTRLTEEEKKNRGVLIEDSRGGESAVTEDLFEELAAREEELAAEVQALRKERDEAREGLLETQKRADEAEGKVSKLSAKLEVAKNGSSSTRLKILRDSLIKEMLWNVFPRLALDEDSVTEIVNHFPKPAALFSVLKRLDENDDTLKIMRCKGKGKNVYEVADHIQTGDPSVGDRGRIYLREGFNRRERTVFVRLKKDQKQQSREIERIASMDQKVALGFDGIL